MLVSKLRFVPRACSALLACPVVQNTLPVDLLANLCMRVAITRDTNKNTLFAVVYTSCTPGVVVTFRAFDDPRINSVKQQGRREREVLLHIINCESIGWFMRQPVMLIDRLSSWFNLRSPKYRLTNELLS